VGGISTVNNNGANGGTGLKFTASTFNNSSSNTTAGSRTLILGGSNTDSNEISGAIVDNLGAGATNNLTKAGSGRWILSGSNSYTGQTTVSAGSFIISSTGSIAAASAVSVASSAAIGGDGTINGNLTLANGARLVFDLNNTPLTVGGTFSLDSSFSVASLVAATLTPIDWSTTPLGTYSLIGTTTVFNAGNIQNFGVANAFVSGGRQMYFENGSLNLVVGVPEPSTWTLLAFGVATILVVLRRRCQT